MHAPVPAVRCYLRPSLPSRYDCQPYRTVFNCCLSMYCCQMLPPSSIVQKPFSCFIHNSATPTVVADRWRVNVFFEKPTPKKKQCQADQANADAQNNIPLVISTNPVLSSAAMRCGFTGAGCDYAYDDLPPNPGMPGNFCPAGSFGRPKFSSRSRMTLRAFRLRRYGRGAFASSRPTEGSRLDSE